jgi:Tol biopolymer transport system component
MTRHRITACGLALVLVLSMLAGAVPPRAAAQSGGTTTRVSVSSDGIQGNGGSFTRPSISADGRYVAFDSGASNLVPDDTNGNGDVFVHDRETGETTRVSVASDGAQGNGGSSSPSISADGRYVAFGSSASNLVLGDTNDWHDVFIHDRQTGETTRVSVASDGAQGNDFSDWASISADGRYVAFRSAASNLVSEDTNNAEDVFVHDRQTGQTSRVSVASDGMQGNGFSYGPSICADGRYVAFGSSASNLVVRDTNDWDDVFVHDRQTGQTSRVSVASDGAQENGSSWHPSISADGRHVAFGSWASNLVVGDTNGTWDIFVHDRQTGQTTRVSVASDGTQGNAESWDPSISSDGRHVAFSSYASNLVSGDANGHEHIYVHDQQMEETTWASMASDGAQGNGDSGYPFISADGRYVAFVSDASNLVPGDTNGYSDVFVHDRGAIPEPQGYRLQLPLLRR